jgi:hypothetical protein
MQRPSSARCGSRSAHELSVGILSHMTFVFEDARHEFCDHRLPALDRYAFIHVNTIDTNLLRYTPRSFDVKKAKQEVQRKQCLFCDNYANSKEDTFPLWLLEVVANRQDMIKTVSDLPIKIQKGSSALRIRTVCENCNNGWMSKLEEDTIPVLRPLLVDLSVRLSPDDQILLASWVMKTGVVLDSIYKHSHFYQKEECEILRKNRTIPTGTVVWIGRYFGNALHAGLSDFVLDSPPHLKIANGCVITFVLGRVVFQILSARPKPEYKELRVDVGYRPGKWDRLLTKIWPNADTQIVWPPPLSFTLHSEFSIRNLVHRFRPTGAASTS